MAWGGGVDDLLSLPSDLSKTCIDIYILFWR